MASPTVVKKYGNRRLYDSGESRYVTLEEIEQRIRKGEDFRILDAKTNEDLTQPMLTQMILEGTRAERLLPLPLLYALIRMGDDALGEFFGQYVTLALESYLLAKRGAQKVAPILPFAGMPFSAADAMARFFLGGAHLMRPEQTYVEAPSPSQTPPPPAPHSSDHSDVAALRRELADLRRAVASVARSEGARAKKDRERRKRPS